MNLPKVCHIIHQDGPGGGPVLIVDQLKATAGHVIPSVIHGGAGKIAAFCDASTIPHWKVSIDRQSHLPLGFFQLIAALRKCSPDVAILYGQWAGAVAPLALKAAGVRRSIYICQWPSFYTDWDISRIIRNRICEAIPCRWCDRVVVVSDGSWYQYAIRRLGEEKLRVIHNGVYLNRRPSLERVRKLRVELGWDDVHCHVVSVGRLSDQKRVDWLLRSWRIVEDAGTNARLWIVGGGPEETKLRQLADDLKITESCVFLGSRENGIEYTASADIVAMTTLYEGHSINTLEALLCGRPLVVSDVDGTRDSLKDGVEGFLVPPADIRGFAEKLLLLIGDEAKRKSMGERGIERAEQFSATEIARQHLELIHEVLAEPSLG